MTLRLALVPFALLLASAPAFAGSTPGTTTPTSGSGSTTTTVNGIVKSFVADKHLLTVTVNQQDVPYKLGQVNCVPECTKVGANVDITLNGTTVTAVVLHKMQ